MNRRHLALPLLLAACSAAPESPRLEQIARNSVQIIDLTYPLNETNAYWPGERYAPFHFEVLATLEADGVYSGAFSTPEHLGTHLDAPNHFEAGQPPVDQIPLNLLVAPLAVVDIRRQCRDNPDYQLSLLDLQGWEAAHGPLPSGAAVFALTGWGDYWEDSLRYQNIDDEGRLRFPGFSPEAARFLVRQRQIKGIGIDTLSVDRGLSRDFAVHHAVNGVGAYHIENAANLARVPAAGAWMLAAPVKVQGGSGAPARVWAVVDAE